MTKEEYEIRRDTLNRVWKILSKRKNCDTALNLVSQEAVRMDIQYKFQEAEFIKRHKNEENWVDSYQYFEGDTPRTLTVID